MATTRNISAPSIPNPPNQYDQRFQNQLNGVFRLFFNTVTNAINAPKPYGSFYDTTTQTLTAINTATPVTFNQETSSYSVTRGSPQSRIYVAETGVYNIQFSLQIDHGAGNAARIYVWLRVNGVDVPNTATKAVIQGSDSEIVLAWNFLETLKSNDYFELIWSSDDTNVIIAAFAASSPVPEIPSVILSVQWVSGVTV